MFECLKNKWRNDFVLKKDLNKFSGGIINEHTFGSSFYRRTEGRPPAIRIGNKTAYKVSDVIEWLNAQPVEKIEDIKGDKC